MAFGILDGERPIPCLNGLGFAVDAIIAPWVMASSAKDCHHLRRRHGIGHSFSSVLGGEWPIPCLHGLGFAVDAIIAPWVTASFAKDCHHLRRRHGVGHLLGIPWWKDGQSHASRG